MGEFEIDRIAELLACGEFSELDFYYTVGMADWDTLASLKKEVEAARAFPPSKAYPPQPVAKRPKIKTPPPRKRQAPKPAGRTQSQSAPSGGLTTTFLPVIIGLVCGYLWTVFFPREKTVFVDRVRAVPLERVVATSVASTVTADDIRRLGLGAAVEAAHLVANGFAPEEKVKTRVEQLLVSRGFRVAASGEESETSLVLEIELFGTTSDISGHIGATLSQMIQAGKERTWRRGSYPVWRRSKYFTKYNTDTLSLLPLLTDELTTEVATALQRSSQPR